MKISKSLADQFMALAGIRYCLGRRSYASSIGQDFTRLYWESFTSETKHCALRDILEAIARDEAGDSLGFDSWQRLAGDLWSTLSTDEQQKIEQAVSYTGRSVSSILSADYTSIHNRS